MAKRRLTAALCCVLAVTGACAFVGYAEFLRTGVPDDIVGAAALPDGKIVVLTCDRNVFPNECRVRAYKNGRALSSVVVGATYTSIDAGSDGMFWIATWKGQLERYRFDDDDRMTRDAVLVWSPFESIGVDAIAVGRGNNLYVSGRDEMGGPAFVGRIKVKRFGGSILGTQVKYVHERFDSLDEFDVPRLLDVDLSTGRLYVGDVLRSRTTTLLAYDEDLSPANLEPHWYEANVVDIEAAEGLVAASTQENLEGGKVRTTIDMLIENTNSHALGAISSSTEESWSQDQFAMAAHRVANDCGYVWTVARHSYNRTAGTVNLFGRHTFCKGDARP
jgi:hypothetical protein